MQSIVRKAFSSGLTVRSNSLKTCVQGVHRYMSSDQTDGNYYDVIISGSGLVGGAMACAIGKLKSSLQYVTIASTVACINEQRILNFFGRI